MKKIEKKKMYMVFGIVMLIIALAGSAYAYYSASASATISGTAGGGNLTINVERLSTSANGDLIPLDNDTTTLNKAILGEGNTSGSFDNTKSCIDKNGYTACQIYKITISNNSSISITLNGGVSLSGDNTPNIECAVMDNNNALSSNTSCKSSKSLANKYSLGANTTKEYYILVYIKNIEEEQTDTGNFTGIVTFISSDGAEVKARFEEDPALTTLNNLGLSVDTSHTPDFTTVSGNSGEDDNGNTGLGDGTNGVYEAEDDLGTSYYFRGNVDNNYVYFAKNWWQIIRINGDGTIRMIYVDSNKVPSNEPVSNTNDKAVAIPLAIMASGGISVSSYNSSYDDNAYVGYMYGTTGSTTYNATHANTNDSTIKTVIDTWYTENLSSYSSYIADAIYCNDREAVNDSNTNTVFTNMFELTNTGLGYGTNDTAYANLKRNYIDHTPTLKCKNKNDRFTTSSTLGNGALTNPIALITTDEVVMAGAHAYDLNTDSYIMNSNYYLNLEYPYWTMTPVLFAGGYALVDYVNNDGLVSYVDVHYSSAVRPVVSLLSDAITGGDGTVSNPFYVNEAYTSLRK